MLLILPSLREREGRDEQQIKEIKMKFVISINQEKLIELAPEANLVHGAILDYLFWFCASTNKEIEAARIEINGLRYTWVNYDWLLNDMPLLKGKTKATLTPVFKKLEEWGFIKTYIISGGRKYVYPGDKLDELFRNLNATVLKTKRKRLENKTNQYIYPDTKINKDNLKILDQMKQGHRIG